MRIRLKGQFQGQQTRGERGKKTLPAIAARLLNFNFLFFFFFANYYNTHIVLYQQALSHNFFDFFLGRALRHRRP